MITSVLFDLDGTVADTNALILTAITETLTQASGQCWDRARILPYWGVRLREQLTALHPAIDLEAAVAFYRARYRVLQLELLRAFTGMRDVLVELRRRGYRLGVVTSKLGAAAHETLTCLGYAELFDLVVADQDTARHKPHPDPLWHAAQRMGIAVDAAAYIGDNPDDIRAAHAAGMRGIAVAWGMRPRHELLAVHPDAMIDTPAELLAIFPGLPAEVGVSPGSHY